MLPARLVQRGFSPIFSSQRQFLATCSAPSIEKSNISKNPANLDFLQSNPAAVSGAAGSINAAPDSSISSPNLKKIEDIPSPKSLPFIGNLKFLMDNDFNKYMHELMLKLEKEHGDVVRLTVLGNNIIYLFDPMDIQKVQRAEGRNPIGGVQTLEKLKTYFDQADMSDDSVLFNEGEKWRQIRSELQKGMFSPQAAEKFLPQFNKAVEEASKLMPKYSKDIIEFLPKLTFELMGRMLYSKRLGGLSNPEPEDQAFMENTIAVMGYMSKNTSPVWKYLPTKEWRDFKAKMDVIFKRGVFHADTLIQKMADKTLTEEESLSYVANLLRNEKLTKKQVLVNAATMLFAGVDTTSVAMSWVLYHLAANPKVQEKLAKELFEKLNGGNLTEESLQNVSYLKNVVKESARLDPAALAVPRKIPVDLEIKGYLIPKGTQFLYGSYAVFHNEQIFENPYEFQPERWDEEHRAQRKSTGNTLHDSPYSLFPFSVGPRMCIGSRIANMEIYSMLSRVIQDYKLRIAPTSPPTLGSNSFLYRPTPFPELEFIPRK
jgi:cytochrome P450